MSWLLSRVVPKNKWEGRTHGGLSQRCRTFLPLGTAPLTKDHETRCALSIVGGVVPLPTCPYPSLSTDAVQSQHLGPFLTLAQNRTTSETRLRATAQNAAIIQWRLASVFIAQTSTQAPKNIGHDLSPRPAPLTPSPPRECSPMQVRMLGEHSRDVRRHASTSSSRGLKLRMRSSVRPGLSMISTTAPSSRITLQACSTASSVVAYPA